MLHEARFTATHKIGLAVVFFLVTSSRSAGEIVEKVPIVPEWHEEKWPGLRRDYKCFRLAPNL